MKAYELIEREEFFHGRIMDVVVDTITLPNGKTAKREIVLRGNAAAVLPVDDDGNIVFVRQYRHPARNEILEIPAGMLEESEDPAECARRELEEETGLKSDNISPMFSMYASVGLCDEIIHIFLAENLKPGVPNPDEDEFITIEKYSIDQVSELIFSGKIMDSKTISAVFAYKEILSKKLN